MKNYKTADEQRFLELLPKGFETVNWSPELLVRHDHFMKLAKRGFRDNLPLNVTETLEMLKQELGYKNECYLKCIIRHYCDELIIFKTKLGRSVICENITMVNEQREKERKEGM